MAKSEPAISRGRKAAARYATDAQTSNEACDEANKAKS
jgi:hypothetical protein